MTPMLEKAARAVEDCRIASRDARNLKLADDGMWPDHSHQPSNVEIARAVLLAVRELPDDLVGSGACTPESADTFTGMINAILGEPS